METESGKRGRSRQCGKRVHCWLTIARLALAITVVSACVHSPRLAEPDEVPAHEPEVAPAVTPTPPGVEEEEPVAIPQDGLFILISKTDRVMRVYSNAEIVHRYRIGLGFQPQGHKRWEGDGRTPEGQYTVAVKNPQSRYFLSLGLNYPLPSDAATGYAQGRISLEQYQAIEDAYYGRKVPPWNTRLGGAIYIHGRGSDRDWTRGCIALEDADMRQLYKLVDIGTPVTIMP